MPDFAGNQSIREITKISPGVACLLLLLPLSLPSIFCIAIFCNCWESQAKDFIGPRQMGYWNIYDRV